MPYGDLERQAVQRFATMEDLTRADCTVEEREEYEPHIAAGGVVFAGVDYARILAAAEAEADIVLWEGGNNDFPFLVPDLHIALADALRPGHETAFHPGETVLRMADIVVLMKADGAPPDAVAGLARAVAAANPSAKVVRGASPVRLESESDLAGRRVLVIEDGPTITHGGMPHGAGFLAARRAGAEVVDPRPWLDGSLAESFRQYPHIGPVLPALGYDAEQLAALARVIAAVDADLVVAATPIDLAALIASPKPILRVRYDYAEMDDPGLGDLIDRFLAGRAKVKA
jgi:predicted GTPase